METESPGHLLQHLPNLQEETGERNNKGADASLLRVNRVLPLVVGDPPPPSLPPPPKKAIYHDVAVAQRRVTESQ